MIKQVYGDDATDCEAHWISVQHRKLTALDCSPASVTITSTCCVLILLFLPEICACCQVLWMTQTYHLQPGWPHIESRIESFVTECYSQQLLRKKERKISIVVGVATRADLIWFHPTRVESSFALNLHLVVDSFHHIVNLYSNYYVLADNQ